MSRGKLYFEKLLSNRGLDTSKYDATQLEKFLSEEDFESKFETIQKIQKDIMEKWQIRTSIIDVQNEQIIIPNGTQNIVYKHSFSVDFFSKLKITKFQFEGLEESGLSYDSSSNTINGKPSKSGRFPIKLKFKVEGELETAPLNDKELSITINPDPKLLWKNIPSDKDDHFWKEDNQSDAQKVGEKSLIISSKRGRSHQNVGSFRDDDYGFKHFEENGWTIVAVSDGAGSYPLARHGSEFICNEVITEFGKTIQTEEWISNEAGLAEENQDAIQKANSVFQNISKTAHEELDFFANKTKDSFPDFFNHAKAEKSIEYFHATLIYAAFKKINDKYVILTFSVGDCPIGLVNKTESKLLNWLDVGEFGGGTRFVTQSDIFVSKERPIESRFNYVVQEDFSYLFLMTDGIYDPKFEVEANLEKPDKWQDFIKDLKGENEDQIGIDFNGDLETAKNQLDNWLDFWSRGNHDDRTLAIIF